MNAAVRSDAAVAAVLLHEARTHLEQARMRYEQHRYLGAIQSRKELEERAIALLESDLDPALWLTDIRAMVKACRHWRTIP